MLKCNSKNPKFKNLTIGKDYEGVIEGDFAEVVNDSGVKSRYHKKYFSAAAIVPPAPQITTLSLEDILREISVVISASSGDGSYRSISIRSTRTISATVYLDVVSNTCGVIEIDGINSVDSLANDIITNIGRNPLEITSVTTNQLFDSLMMLILREIRNNADLQHPFYMLSTNNPDRNSFVNFNRRFALTNSSSKTTNRINPNSNNEIAVWIIDAEELLVLLA